MTVPPVTRPGTTNLITNPWFAVNTTGWEAATNCQLARVTTWSAAGPGAGYVTRTNFNGDILAFTTVSISSGTVYTISAIVRNPGAVARTVRLRYNNADVVTQSLAAGAIARIQAVITGAASTAVGVGALSIPVGQGIEIGHVQVEAGSRMTAPCPTIDGDGTIVAPDTWSGAAHASTSTRPDVSTSGFLVPGIWPGPLRIGKD